MPAPKQSLKQQKTNLFPRYGAFAPVRCLFFVLRLYILPLDVSLYPLFFCGGLYILPLGVSLYPPFCDHRRRNPQNCVPVSREQDMGSNTESENKKGHNMGSNTKRREYIFPFCLLQ